MKLFRNLLFREFLPFFLLGVLFFALILVLADTFSNLWRYLNQEVPFSQALWVSLLYGPKALSFALPIGSMFAAAFALGNLGSRNELIAVFASGVSRLRFVLPMILIAILLSVGGFVFEDQLVIPTMQKRNHLSRELLGIQDSKSRSRATAIGRGGQVFYLADYYNDETRELTELTVILLDEADRFRKRIDAQKATWDESGSWLMEECRIFTQDSFGEVIQEKIQHYSDDWVDEDPETFRLDTRKIEEMNGKESRLWIETQKRAGLPYKEHQAEYYQRFSMALTPFLVILFAGALGGRFRRNILLMSLLVSLGLSSAWYVGRMMSTLLSKIGMVSPLVGALAPFVLFLALGGWLFRQAQT